MSKKLFQEMLFIVDIQYLKNNLQAFQMSQVLL